MPTQRRRIGFLPSSEVQNIIDKICNHNKLSQSKVTGILVEEALRSRGVLILLLKNYHSNFVVITVMHYQFLIKHLTTKYQRLKIKFI